MKTSIWNCIRAKLKPRFEAAGITFCELQLKGCLGNQFLSFAHAKKRRFLKPEEYSRVILTCQNCHSIIEAKSHELMEAAVEMTIEQRSEQPKSITEKL